MLSEAEEFLEELDGMCLKYGGGRGERGKERAPGSLDGLSELERAVMAVLDYQPLSLTGIYEEVNLNRDDDTWKDTITYSLQQVSSALIGLCMKKFAKQLSGNYYIRC